MTTKTLTRLYRDERGLSYVFVGVGFMGSTSGTDQFVYGSVISNETSTDPMYEGVVYADAKLRYSCEAIALAGSSRKLITMSSWTEVSQ